MNESVLIAKTDRFLDGIKHNPLKIDNINNFEDFLTIYQHLKNTLDDLLELRDTMEIKGYKTPYKSLMKYGRTSKSEMKVDDIYDVNKHTQYFRMNAAAKKNILDRVKSAIASHKIAIGHLEEYAIFTCENCGENYNGHELETLVTGKCKCGSDQIQMKVNDQGIYRLEIMNYLPLSGDYMVKMSELSPLGRDAFRRIVRSLKQEKRGIVKTVSMVIKVFQGDRWVRKRVNIDADDQMNYEREIRNKYGSDARIEFMQFHRKKPSLINDKHVQTALSIAYVKLAENKAGQVFRSVLEAKIKNIAKLERYDQVVKESKELTRKLVEDPDDMEQIKKEILEDKLLKEGFEENGKLDPELRKDITVREKLRSEIYQEVPRILILWDILRWYITSSFDRRNKYVGPFPNIRPSLDTNQLRAFEDFDPDVVDILKAYMHENIEYVSNMKNVLMKKFEIENKMKGLHVKTNPNAAGAALLTTEGKLPLEAAAKVFNTKPEDVETEITKFKTFGKPQTKKAKKFLDLIKS
jgi:Zn-finger domain-containing protein